MAALEQDPNYQSVRPNPKSGNGKPSRAKLLRNLVDYQYTGVCVQLSHSVGQDGGNTSYSFAQARVHREDTEFLGVDKITRSRKTGKTNSHKNTYAYPAGTTPKVGGKGPRGGKITAVKNVTPKQLATTGQDGIDPSSPYYVNYDRLGHLKTTPTAQTMPLYDGNGTVEVGPDPEGDPTKSYYAWQVTETIDVRETFEDRRPIEEAIRPPWIWTGWCNLSIGDTYKEMIGTNAITDVQGVLSKAIFSESQVGTDEQVVLDETKDGFAAGSGAFLQRDDTGTYTYNTKQTPIQDQPTQNTVVKRLISDPFGLKNVPAQQINAADVYMIDSDRTIETSIDFLVRAYSLVKVGGFDVGDFIRQYTWRPIMNIDQLLGTRNLLIDPSDGTVLTGTEGFHSRAFGDEANLAGLVNAKVHHILGLDVEKDHTTLMRLDTRQRKWQAVKDYVDELTGDNGSRGLLG